MAFGSALPVLAVSVALALLRPVVSELGASGLVVGAAGLIVALGVGALHVASPVTLVASPAMAGLITFAAGLVAGWQARTALTGCMNIAPLDLPLFFLGLVGDEYRLLALGLWLVVAVLVGSTVGGALSALLVRGLDGRIRLVAALLSLAAGLGAAVQATHLTGLAEVISGSVSESAGRLIDAVTASSGAVPDHRSWLALSFVMTLAATALGYQVRRSSGQGVLAVVLGLGAGLPLGVAVTAAALISDAIIRAAPPKPGGGLITLRGEPSDSPHLVLDGEDVEARTLTDRLETQARFNADLGRAAGTPVPVRLSIGLTPSTRVADLRVVFEPLIEVGGVGELVGTTEHDVSAAAAPLRPLLERFSRSYRSVPVRVSMRSGAEAPVFVLTDSATPAALVAEAQRASAAGQVLVVALSP